MMMENSRPERLGRYFLMDLLAFGGMAEIYRAKTFDAQGNEYVVAIKRVLSNLSANDELIRMLIHEARIASMIHHPCVVRVYEFCQVQDEYFIVMELVDGKDLKTILDRLREIQGGIPISDAVYITICALTGLHAAHILRDADGKPLQLIHRDMSPSNILISYAGEVKICDFGIAKTNVSSIQTRTGIVRGKVKYMSPEQAMGWKLDLRTDIFSVGALLYEMLTNTPPFLAANEVDILKKIKDGKFTPVRQLNPAVPPMLQSIVHKALAKDRMTRYQSAHEFSQALKQFLSSFAPTYTPAALAMWMEDMFRREHLDEQQMAVQYTFNPTAVPPQDVGVNLLAEDGSDEIIPVFMMQPPAAAPDVPNWLMRETTQVFEISDELLESDPSPDGRQTDQFNTRELFDADSAQKKENTGGTTDEFQLGPALKMESAEHDGEPLTPLVESAEPEIIEKSNEPLTEEDFIVKLKDVSGDFVENEIVALSPPLTPELETADTQNAVLPDPEEIDASDILTEDASLTESAAPGEPDTDPRVKLSELSVSNRENEEELEIDDIVEPDIAPASGNPADAFMFGEIEIQAESETEPSPVTIDLDPFLDARPPDTNPQVSLEGRHLVPDGQEDHLPDTSGDFVIELSMQADSDSGTSYMGEIALDPDVTDVPVTQPSIRSSVILDLEDPTLPPKTPEE